MNTFRHSSLCTRNGIVYNIRKLWLLPILFCFFAATFGCNESGLSGRGVVPEITSTTPAANADNVPVSTSISVTFSEAMDSTSIYEGTFMVQIDTVNISGTLSYSDLTAVFVPISPLEYGSTYSVMVSSEVESQSGTNLADSYEWSFSTEEGASAEIPQVISTNPAHNAEDVLLSSAIKVSFSKPMNSNSLNTSTFTVFEGSTAISGLVTSAGSSATFSPLNILSKGSTYHAVISSDVEDTLGNNLENDFEWSFTTVDDLEGAPLQIQAVNPSDDERDVPAEVVISASFNNALDNATVNSSTFLVTQNGNSVSGSIGLSGSTVSFTPNTSFPYGAEVTAVLTTGVEDEAGSSLPDNYQWSFVIMEEPDTISPEVVSTSPVDNAEEVEVNTVITATFSEAMNESTINTSTIIVSGGGSVPGSVDYSGNTVTFTPNSDLQENRTYTVIITTGAEDVSGNALENNVEWSFTTLEEPEIIPLQVQSVNPSNDASNVPADVVISASFNNALDNSTVNSSTFLVTQNGNSVSGSINVSGSTLSFTPNASLPYGSEVTAVLTTGVEDEAGSSLPDNYQWSFVIMEEPDTISPEVISTSPADNAIDVEVNAVITATFSEAMNASTINTSTMIVSGGGSVRGSVNYSDNRVTFTPNNDFQENRTYTVTITTGTEDISGNALENNVEWSFTTFEEPEIIPLQVQSVNPSDGASNVSADVVISASFNKALDNATVNSSTFLVTQNGNSVSGSINVSGSTVSFTPNTDLPYGAEVTAIITTGVEDEDGSSLADNYEWSFVIMDEPDNTPPEVISTSPADNAIDVEVNSVITATFSEAMNVSTINNSTMIVSGGGSVSGSVDYSGNTVTFTPNSDLPYGTEVTVVLTTGVEDEAGNSLPADYQWSFVLMDEPDTISPEVVSTNPVDNAEEVEVNSVITATFSEAMNVSTINTSTMIVSGGGTVSGSVDYSGNTVTFTPNSDLPYGTEVTVVLTTGIEDEAGNSLPADYQWSFVIMDEPDTISPEVISTSPVDNAEEVDVNAIITATFSEPMNASTINTSTITVSGEGTVPGNVDYSGNTVTFTPNSDFQEDRTYTVTITTGAEDLAGNALESDVIWTFQTESDDDDDDD